MSSDGRRTPTAIVHIQMTLAIQVKKKVKKEGDHDTELAVNRTLDAGIDMSKSKPWIFSSGFATSTQCKRSRM